MVLTGVIGLLAGAVFGVLGLYIYRQMLDEKVRDFAKVEADRIMSKAKSNANRLERDAQKKAKDFEVRARRNAENDIRKEKQKIQQVEGQLKNKESRLEKEYQKKAETLQSKLGETDEREQRLEIAEQRIKDLEKQTTGKINELQEKLEAVANMSTDQARHELKTALEEDARREASQKLSHIEEEALKEANKKARQILSTALARYASEVTTERTVTSLPLSGDEMKGKIIGREGRNIRALEAACGVDIIIDETPDSVMVSSFDPVRREVGRRTLLKLMDDGRVHPARIEEVVDKVKKELLRDIKEDGEKACFDLGIPNVHPEILNLLGSLKYRSSATQNLYEHSLEVGYVAGLMAAEIGADVKLARRAGLLHDIGKSIDHTVEGSHAIVGADFARRHGETDQVVHAIRAHHGEEEPQSVTAHIVQAANEFSKARPGARRSSMQNFIRRLEDLESIGNSFDGVERTFAIQSGKEIRVLVDSGKITDDQSVMLSRDIARKIERELNYPGQIKVNVVRETRMVEHAR
ncbi:MAG: ribonuclease Y [Pseudobdellovibrionaceae bacterium]|nr:ribonuclease Y [Bdellovibrionales bacterium]USN48908.1 MAG: ribonuclease Y [Pseudobdellovibrionaceae bacterium]